MPAPSIIALTGNSPTTADISINQGTLPDGYTDKFLVNADYWSTAPAYTADPASDSRAVVAATLTSGNHTAVTLTGLTPGTMYYMIAARYNYSGVFVSSWGMIGVWTTQDRLEIDFISPYVADFSKPFGETWRGHANDSPLWIPPHRRVFDAGTQKWKLVIDTTDVPAGYFIATPNRLWSSLHDITVEMTFKMHGWYQYASHDFYSSEHQYDGWITQDFNTGSKPIYGTGNLQYSCYAWDGYTFYFSPDVPVTMRMEYLVDTPSAGHCTLKIYCNGTLVSNVDHPQTFKGPMNFWTTFLDYALINGGVNSHPSQTEITDFKVWGKQVHGIVGGNNASMFNEGFIAGSANNIGYTNEKEHLFWSSDPVLREPILDLDGIYCARPDSPEVGYPLRVKEGDDSDEFNIIDPVPMAICQFHTRTPVIGVPTGAGSYPYGLFYIYARQGGTGDYLKIFFRYANGTLVPNNLIMVVSPSGRNGQVNSTGFQAYVDIDNEPLVLDLSAIQAEVYADVQGNNTTVKTPGTSPMGPALMVLWVEMSARLFNVSIQSKSYVNNFSSCGRSRVGEGRSFNKDIQLFDPGTSNLFSFILGQIQRNEKKDFAFDILNSGNETLRCSFPTDPNITFSPNPAIVPAGARQLVTMSVFYGAGEASGIKASSLSFLPEMEWVQ